MDGHALSDSGRLGRCRTDEGQGDEGQYTEQPQIPQTTGSVTPTLRRGLARAPERGEDIHRFRRLHRFQPARTPEPQTPETLGLQPQIPQMTRRVTPTLRRGLARVPECGEDIHRFHRRRAASPRRRGGVSPAERRNAPIHNARLTVYGLREH